MTETIIQQIALSFIPRLGPIRLRQLVTAAGSIQQLFDCTVKSPLSLPGIPMWYLPERVKGTVIQKAINEQKRMERLGIQMVHFQDPEFPAILNHYPDAPVNLFYLGSTLPDHRPTMGVVGTRKPSPEGINNTQNLINSYSNAGLQFVSGLAYGIDVSMHKACIANNQTNFAILGHGLDTIYPSAHRQVAERIKKNGALISEYPTLTKPDRQHFPQRNRIIAALSDVIIVVESKEAGGSMITAELANQYGKEVFAFPGRIDDETSKGCNALIKRHQAHLLQSSNDIEYITGWSKAQNSSHQQGRLFEDLSPEEENIITLLRANKTLHIDAIQAHLTLEHSILSSQLLSLEFKGIIRPLPGKLFTLLKV